MRSLDANKICVVMCTNNNMYFEEAFHYINGLVVPDGYELQVLTTSDATGMAAGYNEIMNSSDAKYKIYIHQDVMLVNRNLLLELIDIFKNPSIGMVGMVGAPTMPEDGVMWHGDRIGSIYTSNVYNANIVKFGSTSGKYGEVAVIDGLFMATQYDLPWRDDLFPGWHMYDASQSFEFHRNGYKIVVPNMDKPWVIHDDGLKVLDDSYYQARKKFVDYYLVN